MEHWKTGTMETQTAKHPDGLVQPGGSRPLTSRPVRGLISLLIAALLILPARAATNTSAPAMPRVSLRTNLAGFPRPGGRTNNPAVAPVAGAKPPPNLPPVPFPLGRTNRPGMVPDKPAPAKPASAAPAAAPAAAVSGGKTNIAKAGTNAPAGLVQNLRQLSANRLFYPIIGGVALLLGGVLAFLAFKPQKKVAVDAASGEVPAMAAHPVKKVSKKVFHHCNILQVDGSESRLWQFDTRSGQCALTREQLTPGDGPLPPAMAVKSWTTLWQPKLNVAWLPAEQVFVRVAQLPRSDFAETLAMVELQLEKLSPMPVAQVVWSIQTLPHVKGDLQTVIVLIASRSAVEEYLGRLEARGYLADRLELPLLDQLQARGAMEDGAWIYPGAAGGHHTALVAWWCGGVLQNIDFLNLPATGRAASLREQLLQMFWAGELEGWLTIAPRWHLIGDAATCGDWEAPLREGLEQPVQIFTPPPTQHLAGLTARRVMQAGVEANLLPPEFSTRYQQQFVDRLWMRGLAGVVLLYLFGVLVYGAILGVATWRTTSVEDRAASLAPAYTNAIQLRARFQVLKDRQELKFAALECYKIVAELMPADATLEGLNFSDGKKLSLNGTAPTDKVEALLNFDSAIRKYKLKDQLFFDTTKGDNLTYRANPNNTSVSWGCTLELMRVEAQ